MGAAWHRDSQTYGTSPHLLNDADVRRPIIIAICYLLIEARAGQRRGVIHRFDAMLGAVLLSKWRRLTGTLCVCVGGGVVIFSTQLSWLIKTFD